MKVIGWMKSKRNAVFAVIVAVLFMSVLLVVQDIKNSEREFELNQKNEQLGKELKEVEEFSDFLQDVNGKVREENVRYSLSLQEASRVIMEQSRIIERLVEYLKSIDDWPPKISPPKPVNPSTLANNRSDA